MKYEEVYLKTYQDGRDARAGIGEYFRFYNTQRPHQALGYKTPAEEYFSNRVVIIEEAMIESGEQDIQTITAVRMSGHYLTNVLIIDWI